MKIRILPPAEADLAKGADFYELQRAGLGKYFPECLIADVDALVQNAGIHSKFRSYHRSISKRFPFAIFYKTNGIWVDVYAILDCRRDPRTIDRLLEQRKSLD